MSGGFTSSGSDYGAMLAGIAAVMSSAASMGSSSGGTSVYKTNKLMALQNMYQQDYLRNYYSNARQSLNKAGYNPMVAFMSSPSGGQTNASAQHGNNSSAVSSSLGHLGELIQVSSNIDNTNASTGLMQEQAKTEQAKRVQMDFDNNIKKLEAAKYNKDLEWYDREHAANMLELYYRAQNLRAQTELSSYNAQTARISANAQAEMSNISRENLGIQRDSIIKEQKYREEHPIYNFVDRWSKALSPWVNSGAQIYGTYTNSKNNYSGYEEFLNHYDSKGNLKGRTTRSYYKKR